MDMIDIIWTGLIATTVIVIVTGLARRTESLLAAARSGSTLTCRLLLAAGCDVDQRQSNNMFTPLHKAAIQGHERIIQLLLSHMADVDSRNYLGFTPLHLASQEGHLGSVLTLLQAGADPLLPNNFGALPIHMAAQHNHSEVVKIMIEQGRCSPDQVTLQPLSPLVFTSQTY